MTTEFNIFQTNKTFQVRARRDGNRLFVTGPTGRQCAYKSFNTESAAKEWIDGGKAEKAFAEFKED